MSEKVLEKCDYCGEMHEQENPPLTYYGRELKVCPKVKVGEFFNPKVWERKLNQLMGLSKENQQIIDNPNL